MNTDSTAASARASTASISGRAAIIVLILLAGGFRAPGADQPNRSPSHCDLCLKAFIEVALRSHDAVTGETKVICHRCNKLDHFCYACGMPILKNWVSLEDGRHYCARDASTAVLDTNAVLRIARETDAALRRQFQDVLEFPDETTIERRVIDRIEYRKWYRLPGQDYQCPNLLGVYEPQTNGVAPHRIHVLSGLTAGETRATYAHELTHAWFEEHVPAKRNLDQLAEEGFCELIAYMHATQAGEVRAQQLIITNGYTRGQFALFRRAQETYNLPTILDWLKFGGESLLDGADLDMVRRAEPPPRTSPQLYIRYVTLEDAASPKPESIPEVLELKAIVGTAQRRTALVNGRAFLIGESGKVRRGEEWVNLRCLEITGSTAAFEVVDSGEKVTLQLPATGK